MLAKRIPKWLALWFLLIAALSLAPLPVKRFFHTTGPLHNAGHIVVFCISGVLLLSAATSPVMRAVSLPALFVFCAAMELLQAVIYRLPFEWRDLLVDACSLVLAPALLFIFQASTHLARRHFAAVKTNNVRHDLE